MLLRNQLRLDDVTLSLSSLLVELRGLSGIMSIFDTDHLSELGSKTRCHTHISLGMSNDLLFIMPAVSIPITMFS